jgi:hypothetical protein
MLRLAVSKSGARRIIAALWHTTWKAQLQVQLVGKMRIRHIKAH